MYSVYIIYSPSVNKYYVGYTEQIENRLLQHNTGLSKFTSIASDWILKYSEAGFSSRADAAKREREIKKKKSRQYLEYLISSAG